jgi:nicotinate-nucleotide adenylyltransferase
MTGGPVRDGAAANGVPGARHGGAAQREVIGILGGTFDPVHTGHLAVALAARDALGLDAVTLVPTRVPPHRPRQPYASIYHRFAMTALAALSEEGLQVSDLELDAPGPSYTSMLLDRLHGEGYDASHIVFIIGADAFAEIATWHNYPAILNRCHFAVISRPGQQADELRARLPDLADRFITIGPDTGTAAPSVALTSHAPAIFLIGAATPDVSSTEIRERRRAGLPIDGLVPEAVEQYIRRHALYAGAIPTAGHLHEHKAQ